MTYHENLVVAIKVGKSTVKEQNHKDGYAEALVPFSSEYSIFLKNMSTKKALVSVSIDGKDVLNNKSLIIEPKSSIDLERFVDDLDFGNRFKFIEKTEKIEQHRGNQPEDGLIEVTWQFESDRFITNNGYWYTPEYTVGRPYSSPSIGSPLRKTFDSYVSSTDSLVFTSCCVDTSNKGITVEGSESNQQFTTNNNLILWESTSHTTIIKLLGISSNPKKQTFTDKVSVKCKTCGTLNLKINNFCTECGTNINPIKKYWCKGCDTKHPEAPNYCPDCGYKMN